jgi:type I restriction enzyme S subunit
LYQEAESILFDALDLKDFVPNTEPINIKSFKDSFQKTGRIDAEYYQKKYEEIVNHITVQLNQLNLVLFIIQKMKG